MLLQQDVCNVSLITMELVDDCPRNNKTLQMRLKSKRCSDFPLCKKEPLVYHCMTYEGNLVEVCAPEGPIIGNTTMDYGTKFSAVLTNATKEVHDGYDKMCLLNFHMQQFILMHPRSGSHK